MRKTILTFAILLLLTSNGYSQRFYDIAGHARTLVSNAIADADRSANYTVNHTANELNVLVYTATQLFGDQMNKQVGQLSESARKVADKIMELSSKIESGQSTIVHLQDNLALDLNNILGNLPFIDKEFIMKRAVGFNHLYKNNGEYQISLTGSNFGFNSDKVRVTFTRILIEENDVTSTVNLNQNIDVNTKKIGLKSEVLNTYFDPKKVKPVKITFEAKREEYKGFFGRSWKETGKISNTIYIYLFPNYSGELKFEVTSEKYDWTFDGDVSTSRTGPNAHCSSGCRDWYGIPEDFEISVPGGNTPAKIGDYKLTEPNIRQTDATPGGFDADVYARLVNCNALNDNCTKVIGHFRARTRPTSYILTAKKWKFDVTGSENTTENKEFEYNKIYRIVYPKATKSIIVSGTNVADGQPFSYNITQGNTIFELVSKDEVNGEFVYQFKMRRPAGQ